MHVYPRSKIWPYLTVVSVLFVLAVRQPTWWISTGQPKTTRFAYRLNRAKQGITAASSAGMKRVRWTVDVAAPAFADEVVEPTTVPLRPPVAQRIAVSPAPEFSAATEAVSTARFPTHATGDVEQVVPHIRLADPDVNELQDVGPILATDALRPLDLSPVDIEGLADTLPTEVMPHDVGLQSAADASAPFTSTWPRAVSLWSLISQLGTETAQVAQWVNNVQDTLNELQTLPTLEDARCEAIFDRLDRLAEKAPSLEVYLSEENRRQLRRIRYGLDRRSTVWRRAHRLAVEQQATPQIVNLTEAVSILQELDERLADHPHGESWRSYLMLDKLTRIANETWVADSAVRRDTARAILRRMSAVSLTPAQLLVLEDPAVKHLRHELEFWADGPVDLPTLVAALEQFEQIRSATIATQVVDQMNALTFCRYAAASQLHQALDLHYRNANVRFSVSAQLLNDLLPVIEPTDRRIRDRILGADVRGQNRTWTDLRLSLVDDASRLRLKIEIDGTTRSKTVSTKGPVRLFTRSRASFRADKQLVVSPEGIYVTHATARANGQSTLLDIETDYDRVPLLGWIVRQIALDEHDDKRSLVKKEVQQRISRQAEEQLDESLQERLSGLEKQLDRAVIGPLRDLELDPTTMEMRTTPNRLVMRYRLAAKTQLAAYTPRPRGVANNVMSVQLHESLANNLLAQLKLEGQRVELEELIQKLADKLKIERDDLHEEIPPDVTLHLGHDRPIQFEFDEERVLVTIRIKELRTPRRAWYNFVVRGRYRADVSQTHVDLQRDGGIELISEQLGFRDQVALRAIFTKVMTRDHRLNILRGRFLSDPRLSQLGVTQFVARDGWIGVSVGPLGQDRVAADTSSPAR